MSFIWSADLVYKNIITNFVFPKDGINVIFWEYIMVIKRDYYLNQLIESKHNGLIKIVTGLRRYGKSYLLFKLYASYL